MKLNELLEKYGDYEVKEGFLNFLEQPKPKTIYDLKKGDDLYAIQISGYIDKFTWNDMGFDKGCLENEPYNIEELLKDEIS